MSVYVEPLGLFGKSSKVCQNVKRIRRGQMCQTQLCAWHHAVPTTRKAAPSSSRRGPWLPTPTPAAAPHGRLRRIPRALCRAAAPHPPPPSRQAGTQRRPPAATRCNPPSGCSRPWPPRAPAPQLARPRRYQIPPPRSQPREATTPRSAPPLLVSAQPPALRKPKTLSAKANMTPKICAQFGANCPTINSICTQSQP